MYSYVSNCRGVTLPILPKNTLNIHLLPPPTLCFLPEGRRKFGFLGEKVPKIAIFSPFLAFFDDPPFYYHPRLYDFPEKVPPTPVITPPYN